MNSLKPLINNENHIIRKALGLISSWPKVLQRFLSLRNGVFPVINHFTEHIADLGRAHQISSMTNQHISLCTYNKKLAVFLNQNKITEKTHILLTTQVLCNSLWFENFNLNIPTTE